MIDRLAHINLRAPQPLLEELRAFYCDIVGLVQGDRPPFENPGYWLYAGEQAVLHLAQASPGEERPAGVRSTFDHVAFSARGRLALENKLNQHGLRFRKVNSELTGQVVLFLKDPAGHSVEIAFRSDEA